MKSAAPVAARRKSANPELNELAVRLQRRLGTQVRIVPKSRGGKGGKIEIAYYSGEELERLLEWFGTQG
jgi:ParB family chromosome partitioning protein